ncbi:hypothetical protein, partial [Pseudomonas fragariae (ex Marin et al. 2024)]
TGSQRLCDQGLQAYFNVLQRCYKTFHPPLPHHGAPSHQHKAVLAAADRGRLGQPLNNKAQHELAQLSLE